MNETTLATGIGVHYANEDVSGGPQNYQDQDEYPSESTNTQVILFFIVFKKHPKNSQKQNKSQ